MIYELWKETKTDPVIYKRIKNYEAAIDSREIVLEEYVDDRVAAHSEVRALNETLKNRREVGLEVSEETIKEMYVYNIDLRKMHKSNVLEPKGRCPNCTFITDGINPIKHD